MEESKKETPQDGQYRAKSKRRGRSGRRYKKGKPQGKKNFPPVECSVCGKSIDSITQAIGGSEENQYSHFDCVLREICDQESIEPGQKISYIGNGEFAVVQYQKKNYSGGFTIVRRISVEDSKRRNAVKELVSTRKRTMRI